jgi:hypothetical protein
MTNLLFLHYSATEKQWFLKPKKTIFIQEQTITNSMCHHNQ